MKANLPVIYSIEVLSDEVASKIAAGEVIERPASVVRELIDNSIDAGASHIKVEIKGGGRDLIRVIDDGGGVEREEMPRAFLRHATSKIRSTEDLWSIRTLGFRGEALFSVAAVSRVSFLSRRQGSPGGYEMVLDGGKIISEGVKGAPYGTVVNVRDLFFNLPARLKFLKSPQAEAAHISALVQQYALAHPHISFSVTNEGRTTLQTPGDGDLRSAAAYVYGSEVARALLPVGIEPEDDDVVPEGVSSFLVLAVHGYTSPPAHSRSNRQAMHFFINRRAIQSRMLQFAVEEAYHSLLMVGRRPICIVNVAIDPALLDVNVHPAKAEVKFRDERAVFSAVQRAVRSALQAHAPVAAYGSRNSEGWALSSDTAPRTGLDVGASGGYPDTDRTAHPELWGGGEQSGTIDPLPTAPARSLPPLRLVGQVGATYIIAEGPDGLFLVDQHAAHERVLYERLSAALETGDLPIQPLLQPVSLELNAAQRAEVEPILPLMAELGFTIEPFGDTALMVRAVPSVYAASRQDVGRDLLEILDTVLSGSRAERWREEMSITLACHSAVRAGQSLSLEEMRSLLANLERCKYPRSCAHGRPTMLHLSQMQLEHEFGRRV